jgi:hypothetical protein
MQKSMQILLGLLAGCLAIWAFSGCGKSESLVHVQGTPASITKESLNHWMQALVGLDFRTSVGTEGPAGLVSEPADYRRCASSVKLIAPKTFLGQVRLKSETISTRCRELYRSVKAQAMSFLISVAWGAAEADELGLKAPEAEVRREFARIRRVPYPTEAQLRKYMAERHLVLSDLLYRLKDSILVGRILAKFQVKVKQAGGGEKTYTKLALERHNRWLSRTSCKAGYVAPDCREYHGPEIVEPSPNSILEAIVQGNAG